MEEIIENILQLATTELPHDVIEGLESALLKETNPIAKSQLETILENIRLARMNSAPICQDTGILIFFLTVGTKFPLIDELEQIIVSAVRKSTEKIPLRPNAVDPLSRENSGDNIGAYIPWINWKVVKGSNLELTVLPKGGGSENACKLGMLSPSQGLRDMKKFVLDSIVEKGGMPCPPIIVGIGIGGGADICLKLAKEQLLRPLGQRHQNKDIASLEIELLEAINSLGIGPMGLGGDTTALDVHMDIAMRHPASFPVGLAVQCWAARRASVNISNNGKVNYISHEVQ
ncbi:MAG: fumarate hydratase [Candidatus Lokiarchaeota archaeon]|nr:fumarate hydratase [Candidatus Lokiarchaeota archaeon]